MGEGESGSTRIYGFLWLDIEEKEEFLSKERKFHKSLTGIKRIMFHVKHFWRAIGKMQQPEKKTVVFYQIRLLELDEREEFINVVSRKI